MPEQRVFGTPYLSGGIKWWPTAKSVRNPKLKQHRRMRRFHFHFQPNLPCAAWNTYREPDVNNNIPTSATGFQNHGKGFLWIVINSPCPSCTLCQWMNGCGRYTRMRTQWEQHLRRYLKLDCTAIPVPVPPFFHPDPVQADGRTEIQFILVAVSNVPRDESHQLRSYVLNTTGEAGRQRREWEVENK